MREIVESTLISLDGVVNDPGSWALKQDGDGDLVVFGHGQLSHTLLEHGLLDRLRFAVHPVVVGDALGPFDENPKTPLSLVGTHARRSGVVVLNYTVGRT
jgi:dihydrofolate reductase